MDLNKTNLINCARKCATADLNYCNNTCPYRTQGCSDQLLRDLVTELENSYSEEDIDAVCKAITLDVNYILLVPKQGHIKAKIDSAMNAKAERYAMVSSHKEFYIMTNGELLDVVNLISLYEKETEIPAVSFTTIKEHFAKEILVEIPWENITYDMLLKHGKKVKAIKLYRERNGCSLSEGLDAINAMMEK